MPVNVVSTHPASGGRRHPLMFVHGAWHASWCWERMLPWFAERGWQCHALDLRGHGESPSDRSLRRTRIRHYVDDLAEAIDSIGADPILIGHSMGGLVVQRLLEERRLPAAVLLAPIPLGGVLRATLRTAWRHPLKFLEANARLDLGPLVDSPRMARSLLFPPDVPEEEVAAHWRRLQGESYLAYLDMMLLVRARPQLVRTPMTIVAGSADRLFGVEEIRRLGKAYGVDPTVIAGAGHDLMLDPRWEQAAEAIEQAIDPPGGDHG